MVESVRYWRQRRYLMKKMKIKLGIKKNIIFAKNGKNRRKFWSQHWPQVLSSISFPGSTSGPVRAQERWRVRCSGIWGTPGYRFNTTKQLYCVFKIKFFIYYTPKKVYFYYFMLPEKQTLYVNRWGGTFWQIWPLEKILSIFMKTNIMLIIYIRTCCV
jgi:hypothetical protein